MANTTFDEEFDNGLGNDLQTQYAWAQSGFATGDMASFQANPSLLPGDANTVSVDNGALTLSDIPKPSDVSSDQIGGLSRIAGQVETEGTFSQTYGYFEARIQMPAGSGEMGAFWLSGTSGLSPQLDIAEMVSNSPNTIVNTVWNSDTATNNWTNVADMTQGYHTYAVDWEPDFITWYFDGQQTFQVPTPSNLHSPLFLVAGLTSGQPGSWEGVADSSSSSQMKIDYIRAYDANPYTSGGALTFQSSDNGNNPGSTNTTSSSTDTGSSSPANATADTSNTGDSSGAQSTASDSGTTNTTVAPINSVTVNAGSDTLSATSSPDVFLFDGSDHRTTISDFDPSVDKLDFAMTSQDFSDVSITTGRNGFARINFDGNQINLPGVTADQLTQNNFVFNTASQ